MQFYKTYSYILYEEQIEKTIFNKHENNYTSKVEKSFKVNEFLSRFSLTQRKRHRKNGIFNVSVCLKKSTTIKMPIAYINLLSFGAFFIIVASIVVRQLFLQEIWKYIDLNGGVTRWQIITIVSRVKLNRVLYMRATS